MWQAAGGVFGTAPEFPDGNFFICIAAVFRWPYGLYGVGGCVAALSVLVFMVMRMGYSETGVYDRECNLIYSNKGTYGTAGFMTKKELKGVLDLVPNIRKHPGIILGEIDGEVICVPEKTRFNGNLAVYGASGSKKTRAFCMNMILQSAARKSSLVICDPKSELYEKSSAWKRPAAPMQERSSSCAGRLASPASPSAPATTPGTWSMWTASGSMWTCP